ncbi:hypothetical protein ACJMK2_023130 [Sinanodonta woodiana]
MLGLHFCQMGPALPDLRLIIQKDLETASWLFVSRTVGYVVGAFVSGYLYDRYNRLLLLSLALALMGATNGAVPWFESFPLMIAIVAFHGFFMSAVDTGGFTVVVSIWGAEGRSYVQAMSFMFGMGGALSPLLTELFLAEQRPEHASQNLNSSVLNYSINHGESQKDVNSSYLNLTVSSIPTSLNVISNESDHLTSISESFLVWEETKVQYAYLLTSILCIVSAFLPMLVLYLKKIYNIQSPHKMKDDNRLLRHSKMSAFLKQICLVHLCALISICSTLEDTLYGFTMTFSLMQLSFTKALGSIATSVFTISLCFGRFTGIFILQYFQPSTLMLAYSCFLFLALLSFLLACLLGIEVLIWISISLSGLFVSILFANIYTWTEENVMAVTGKVSAALMATSSLGNLIVPITLGILMQNFSPMWFAYLLLIQAFLFVILFTSIFFISKKYIHSHRPSVTILITNEAQELETM